jgi:CheY-like chemotaxis protein
MKHVLIIDESELFREYLKRKLEESGEIVAAAAVNGLDGIAKMRAIVPDLIIIDYHLTRKSCKEVLEEKKRNPNTAKVPVIVTASKIDKNRILELIPLDVKKVFSKPVRIDGLLKTISAITDVEFKVDSTPCMLEAHVNDNIIFIEVAQGLNREKIEMLRFKLTELIQLYDIYAARVLLLMTDLDLSFADAPNLERLMDIILAYSKAKPRNIRILTKSSFIRAFINGHEQYSDIEASDNLQSAIDGLLAMASGYEYGDRKAEMITERLLSSDSARGQGESFQMRFDAEAAKAFAVEDAHGIGRGIHIAVVDDDPVICELAKTTFTSIEATVKEFRDGQAFLDALKAGDAFDLILLDLVMPKLGGFPVLDSLQERGIETPVIVLSAISQRDAIVKAFQAGVKSYLIKPLKPASLIKKAAETLGANF